MCVGGVCISYCSWWCSAGCWAGWAGLGSSCTVTVSPLRLSSALKLQPSGYTAPAPVTGAPGGREGGAGTWAPVRSAGVLQGRSAAGAVQCRGRWCSGELWCWCWLGSMHPAECSHASAAAVTPDPPTPPLLQHNNTPALQI